MICLKITYARIEWRRWFDFHGFRLKVGLYAKNSCRYQNNEDEAVEDYLHYALYSERCPIFERLNQILAPLY